MLPVYIEYLSIVTESSLCLFFAQNISLEEGALFEPLAVAVQAVAKVADLHANKNIAIFGAGWDSLHMSVYAYTAHGQV